MATVLRILVAIAATLAAIAFVFGFFPGVEIYRGDQHVITHAVVERWNWFLGFLVALLAPGFVVWRTPRAGYALLWSLWAIAISTIMFVATFDLLPSGIRAVALWPRAVFGYVMFALLLHLIAIVPIACGVTWWINRDRPQHPVLPVARLVTR